MKRVQVYDNSWILSYLKYWSLHVGSWGQLILALTGGK